MGHVAAPLVLLIIGLVLSFLAAQRQLATNEAAARKELESVATRFATSLHDRLETYKYGLRGARGAFAAVGPDNVSREIFLRYSRSRDIDVEFPGARGFGFIRRVPVTDIEDFVLFQHENGVPDFRIKQLSYHSSDRFIIQYIEPIERNREALGLDIASEMNRRTAAIEAGLSGNPTITEPITILQASGSANRAFLTLLPVYSDSIRDPASPNRYDDLVGWTYAPLVLDEVISGLVDPSLSVAWEISDIGERGEKNLILATQSEEYQSTAFYTSRKVDVFNRIWEISVRASPQFLESTQKTAPSSVALVGIGASVLGCLVAFMFQLARKRAQVQSETQARLATVIENSHQAVIGTDQLQRIVIWNRGAEVLFGVSASDAAGRVSAEVLREEDLKLLDASSLNSSEQSEVVFKRGQSDQRILLVSRSPISSSHEGAWGQVVFVLDVTESRQAERRSAQDTEDFAYTVAHDLRTPLRSVNGFANLLLEGEGERLSEAGRIQLETVVRSSQRMGQMLTSLIDYLRVIKQPVVKAAVDMEVLARMASSSLRDSIGEQSVHVSKLPLAYGDASLLGLAMRNLLENAHKFAKPGETPQISVEFDEAEGAYCVRDKGLGFDPERAQKLFGLFQRLEPHPDIPGLGVGLAITRRIIEKHGRRMWAYSNKGEGATFYFSLERYQADALKQSSTQSNQCKRPANPPLSQTS